MNRTKAEASLTPHKSNALPKIPQNRAKAVEGSFITHFFEAGHSPMTRNFIAIAEYVDSDVTVEAGTMAMSARGGVTYYKTS